MSDARNFCVVLASTHTLEETSGGIEQPGELVVRLSVTGGGVHTAVRVSQPPQPRPSTQVAVYHRAIWLPIYTPGSRMDAVYSKLEVSTQGLNFKKIASAQRQARVTKVKLPVRHRQLDVEPVCSTSSEYLTQPPPREFYVPHPLFTQSSPD